MKALALLLSLIFAPFAMAGHLYLPDTDPTPFRVAVAEAPCIQPVDLLARVREIYPEGVFGIQPLFRYDEAKVFARLVGQEGVHTFYVLVDQKDKKWVIFAANRKACVLLLDGSNATEDKFAQIRGQGILPLKEMADFIAILVQEEKREAKFREPTV